ncbi:MULTISPECIES: cytochrome c peroxidase [Methylomonas]|uniref:Methylamine utilization protein MauG n=2 Tax=Methylomonas TaxID=416 RepID=A0A126T6P6_9GAMM|nr:MULTISPECIES: cytochrome c peroxidase [Methylomonas]AMK77444.1 photosynthetic protein synthase I [Methylomonas denitrificans]OAI05034.1 photosynthetic protein synthase I [Methylomonas methanica]TCV84516.1 cytochrome c peroxidase [Methylomonas methanica]
MKIFIIFCILLAAANAIAQETKPLAPGYTALPFEPAKPGTYTLPIITQAADGEVLTSNNQTKHLHDLMGDKLVLLSFIYAACSDVNGCPLATQVLHKISRQLQKQPELADKLRLLTLSFNPTQDTPEMMRHYGEGFKTGDFDWQFLTTRDEAALQPILDGYQQNVQKVYDDKGQFTGTFSHLLRVYLIDKDKNVRNIYSVDFLHADTLINDVKTLLADAKPQAAVQAVSPEVLFQPGDNKQHYQQADYQTRSLALEQRRGQSANLLAFAQKPPLGLPKLPVPKDNQLTPAKIALGRKLFFDRRLSLNNTFSCAICHIPEQGFSNNEMTTAVGIEGRSVRRNSPSLYNVGYAQLLFHDGRENSLEQQAWGPLLAHNEMANPSIGYVVDKLKASADYRGLFEKAFGKGPTMETIGQALANYQRTLNSSDSAFDRWYFGKQKAALSEPARRGFALFTGKAACSACHVISDKSALFTDQKRHNTGIGYTESMQKAPEKQRVQVAPGVFVDVNSDNLKGLNTEKANDLGYYEISQIPVDRWAYKTPSLRNVALSAPYMHNGSLPTLAEVVKFYNQGGAANENLSPLLKPLGLSDRESADLVAFLEALNGGNVSTLVSDAFAAPVGDSGAIARPMPSTSQAR